jgi:hypothetical protein
MSVISGTVERLDPEQFGFFAALITDLFSVLYKLFSLLGF